MKIPDSKRVVFEKNPIHQVIAQIQFDPVLKINNVPIQFQEKISELFPKFNQVITGIGAVPFKQGQSSQFTTNTRSSWEFKSENQRWVASLTDSSMSLACSEYTEWGNFEIFWKICLESLFICYEVKSINRIGLRYINIISKNEFGLENSSWSGIVNNEFLPWHSNPDIEEHLVLVDSIYQLKDLPEKEQNITLGLGHVEATPEGGKKEICFKIDSDFYKTTKLKGNLDEIIREYRSFNSSSGIIFRWLSTNEFRKLLGKKEKDS